MDRAEDVQDRFSATIEIFRRQRDEYERRAERAEALVVKAREALTEIVDGWPEDTQRKAIAVLAELRAAEEERG